MGGKPNLGQWALLGEDNFRKEHFLSSCFFCLLNEFNKKLPFFFLCAEKNQSLP